MRGINFSNHTNWRDDELIAITDRIATDELTKRTKSRKRLGVEFLPSKSWDSREYHSHRHKDDYLDTHGTAILRKHKVELYIPPGNLPLNFDSMTSIAATIAHEFWHIEHQRGGQHVEIFLRKHWRWGWPKTAEDQQRQNEWYAWVNDYTLVLK